MTPFQLTNKAKSDLKDIALFTERRWVESNEMSISDSSMPRLGA